MGNPGAGERGSTAEQLGVLATAVGVELDDERAAALVPQADQHFALLRALDALDAGDAEPAAEFRLDARAEVDDA